MLGTLGGPAGGERLALDEVHRFPTGPTGPAVAGESADDRGGLFWDLGKIESGVSEGLRAVADHLGDGPAAQSVSVDSWAVDYVPLIDPIMQARPGGDWEALRPRHYRDPRNDAVLASMTDADRRLIFGETGVQFLPFNTLYQLIADRRSSPDRLAGVGAVLTIADYLLWRLSGRLAVEASMASTTQLFDPRTRRWSATLIERFGLPGFVLPDVVEGGTVLGDARPGRGIDGAKVVASNSHDTGCAVAAAPGEGTGWAYLSSGTWSLLGVELPAPVITDRCRALNFTNEQGYAGTTRLLKNLSGLFIVQECRAAWAAGGETIDYADLAAVAEGAEPLRSIIRPDSDDFSKPGDMPAKIDAYCRRTGQPVPTSPGVYARCVYESLALLYRATIGQVEELAGYKIDRLHVVGGGSRSGLLNRLTADATGRTVIAGPVEATAAGNVLIQACALGHLSGLADVRRVVRNSFDLTTYEPAKDAPIARAADRFAALPVG